MTASGRLQQTRQSAVFRIKIFVFIRPNLGLFKNELGKARKLHRTNAFIPITPETVKRPPGKARKLRKKYDIILIPPETVKN